MEIEDPTLLGLALTTYREHVPGGDETVGDFQFSPLIAAIAIWFFRTTIRVKHEPLFLRSVVAVALAAMAYRKESYELIFALELFSFVLPYLLARFSKSQQSLAKRVVWILGGAAFSVILSHVTFTGSLHGLMCSVTPRFIVVGLEKLFPIHEIKAAYRIVQAFSDPVVLRKQVAHLLFVTFHIQAGMGYLGINFLRSEQERRNELLRMDMYGDNSSADTSPPAIDGTEAPQDAKKTAVLMERSSNFKRMAGPFILFSALPYMFQIILYGNINKFAFTCLQHDMHRNIRLHELFEHDSHLTAMAIESSMSPECEFQPCRCK